MDDRDTGTDGKHLINRNANNQITAENNEESQPFIEEAISSFPSLPSPTASQVEINNVPSWAQFIVRNQHEMQRKVEAQATELKVQSGKLKLFQKIMEENKELKSQLEAAYAKIKELESQQSTTTSKEDTTRKPMDQDILLTGTCESIHSLSHEEWEKRKVEIEARKQQQQQQDGVKQLQQLKKLEQSQQQRQQQKYHHQQQQPTKNETATSYAKIAGKNLPPKKRVQQPPTEKMVQWARRLLQPASGPTAYTFIYMGAPRRALHSEIRKALSLVGVAKERVIDIQFPTHGTVGLLVHASYEKEIRELLTQAKLPPKEGFNPIAASTIGIAILRHFTSLPEDPHHIELEYWVKFQEKHPKPMYHKRPQLDNAEDAKRLLSGNNDSTNDGSEPMQEE
ncbi:hypothetical protein BDA99DRAFT_561811 [Phascolomyces articulosus]|uniref:Uncharacterized protein n=1 Tax=Phascolomyces articulosus TaxID=60185 RepID=A0AAD5JWH1_9FUNG|nr:hypothetical protein BDA99DRAFT_561811 [Phascolomyces articulosus]